MASGQGQLQQRIDDPNLRKELERINRNVNTVIEQAAAQRSPAAAGLLQRDLKVSVENKIIQPGKEVAHIDHTSVDDWIVVTGYNRSKSNGGNKVEIEINFNEDKLCELLKRYEALANLALAQRGSATAITPNAPNGAFYYDTANSEHLTMDNTVDPVDSLNIRLFTFNNSSFITTSGSTSTLSYGGTYNHTSFTVGKSGFYHVYANYDMTCYFGDNFGGQDIRIWSSLCLTVNGLKTFEFASGYWNSLNMLFSSPLGLTADHIASIHLHGQTYIYLEKDQEVAFGVKTYMDQDLSAFVEILPGPSNTGAGIGKNPLFANYNRFHVYAGGNLVHQNTIDNNHSLGGWND